VKLLLGTINAYHGAPVTFAAFGLFICCRGGRGDGGFSEEVLTSIPM
jgi:hypothetical protein